MKCNVLQTSFKRHQMKVINFLLASFVICTSADVSRQVKYILLLEQKGGPLRLTDSRRVSYATSVPYVQSNLAFCRLNMTSKKLDLWPNFDAMRHHKSQITKTTTTMTSAAFSSCACHDETTLSWKLKLLVLCSLISCLFYSRDLLYMAWSTAPVLSNFPKNWAHRFSIKKPSTAALTPWAVLRATTWIASRVRAQIWRGRHAW
jgi:hypothetical protein